MSEAAPARQAFVRGWVVLFGLFVIMTITSGFAFYSQGVFLDALVDEQGFSVGVAGAGTGAFFAVSGVFGFLTGGLIGRFDVRWVMTLGTVVGAIGMAGLSQVRVEWQLFVTMALFGCGFALTGLVPTTTVVTRWFARKRSVALSIASTGLSVGGIAIAPALGRLIDAESLVYWAPRFAVAFFVSTLVFLWVFVKPSPEHVGMRPDGAPPLRAGDGPPPAPAGTPFSSAVRSRYFVLMSLGFILIMGSQVGAIQHVYKMTNDRVSLAGAGTALMVLASTSVVARIAGGLVALKVPLSWLTTVLIVVQGVGVSILAVADELPLILVGTVVLGSAMGNLLMLHPLLLADAFGVRDYSRIYGLGSLLMIVGVGSGPFVVGVLRDTFNYRTAFFALGIIAAGGLVIYRLAGRPTFDHLLGDSSVEPARVSERVSGPAPATLAAQPVATGLGVTSPVNPGASPKVFAVEPLVGAGSSR